jgi:drug/metabolite transporter (DMT)-like permease
LALTGTALEVGPLREQALGVLLAAIISMVVISTLLPVVAFLSGLKRIGPTNAAMLSTLEPMVTVLLAIWWLHETLTPVTLLGVDSF